MISFDDFGSSDGNDTIINNITNSIQTINSYITNITADWSDSTIISDITNSMSILSGEIKPYMMNITDATYSGPTSYLYNLSGGINVSQLNVSRQNLLGDDLTVIGTTNSDGTYGTLNALTINRANSIYSIQSRINYGNLSANSILSNTFYSPYDLNVSAEYLKLNLFSNNPTNEGKIALSTPSLISDTIYSFKRVNISGDYLYNNTIQSIKLLNLTGTKFSENYYSDIEAENIIGNSILKNTFTKVSNFNISGFSFNSNTVSVARNNLNCYFMLSNAFTNSVAESFLYRMDNNTIYGYNGILNGIDVATNTITQQLLLGNAYNLHDNSLSIPYVADLNVYNASSNSITAKLFKIKAINFNSNGKSTKYLSFNGFDGFFNNMSYNYVQPNYINVFAESFINNTITNSSTNAYGGISGEFARGNIIKINGDLLFVGSFNSNSISDGDKINCNLKFPLSNLFYNNRMLNISSYGGRSNTFSTADFITLQGNSLSSNTLINVSYWKGKHFSVSNNSFSGGSMWDLSALSFSSNTISMVADILLHVNSLNSGNQFNGVGKLNIDYNLKEDGQSFGGVETLMLPDYLLSSLNTYNSVNKFIIQNVDTLFDASGSYTGEQPISKMWAQYVPFSLLGGGSTINNYTTVSSYSTINNYYTSVDYMKEYAYSDDNYQYNLSGSFSNNYFNDPHTNMGLYGVFSISGLTCPDSWNKFELNGIDFSNISFEQRMKMLNITVDKMSKLVVRKADLVSLNAYSLLDGGLYSCDNASINCHDMNAFTPISCYGNCNVNAYNADTINFYSGNRTINIANSCSSITIDSGNYCEFSASMVHALSAKGVRTLKITARYLGDASFDGIDLLDLNEVITFYKCTFNNINYLKLPSITKSSDYSGYEINVTNSAITSLDIRHLPSDIFNNHTIPLYALQSYNIALHNTSMLLEGGIPISRYA